MPSASTWPPVRLSGPRKKPRGMWRTRVRPRGNLSAAVLGRANGQTGLHAELFRATKKPRVETGRTRRGA